jgi:hypothetical protein
VTLVIEDGSGKENAQSYVDVADVLAYATLYGLGTPAVTSGDIMRAMQFFESYFFGRWVGLKQTDKQALSWPRAFAVRRDGWGIESNFIPVEVKNAASALAIRATTTQNLFPDISRGDQAIEEQIGPIRVKYATNTPVVTVFRDIEFIVRPLVTPLTAGKIHRV